MNLIDFILNLAGLLLWLNWRAIKLDSSMRPKTVTLVGTLRRAAPPRIKRWHFLAAIGALLFLRAIFYGLIGPAVNWTPKIDLIFVTLAFPLMKSGQVFFLSVLLFSLLGFLRVLIVFYFWLLALAFINRDSPEPNPFQKMVQLHLGAVSRWPKYLQAALPVIGVGFLWIILHPILLSAGVTNPIQSNAHLIGQGLLVGAGLYFTLKLLLPLFLFVYMVSIYVFLGNHAAWDFIGTTSRNILSPLSKIPLRFGKMDFAPLVGIILILLLLHALPNYFLRNFSIWPQ